VALAATLYTTLIAKFVLKFETCSSAEAEIVLDLFLNFEKNGPRVLKKRCNDKHFELTKKRNN